MLLFCMHWKNWALPIIIYRETNCRIRNLLHTRRNNGRRHPCPSCYDTQTLIFSDLRARHGNTNNQLSRRKNVNMPWLARRNTFHNDSQTNFLKKGPGFLKMNTSKLKDRAYQQMIENTIQEVLALHIQDPIKRWLVFIETARIGNVTLRCSKTFVNKNWKN